MFLATLETQVNPVVIVKKIMNPKKIVYIIYGILLTWTFGPCISMWSSIVIAFLLGVRGNIHEPILLIGYDIQPIIKFMGAIGYLSMITIPTGLFFITMVSFIVFMIKCKKTKTESESELG